MFLYDDNDWSAFWKCDMTHARELMSLVDKAWLHMEQPVNLMMITGVMIFDEPLDVATVRRVVEERLLHFDRFRQRLVGVEASVGTPYWEPDPHFDVNAHIHHIALPAPGDQATLEALVSDLASTPLDFSKPLWQYHLIDNYGSGCVLVSRLHHCIADGIALMGVLLSMTDDEPQPERVDEMMAVEERPGRLALMVDQMGAAWRAGRHWIEVAAHEGVESLRHPTHAWELARGGLSGAARLARIMLYPPDPDTIYRGRLGTLKRTAWSHPLSLAAVKEVGQAVGGTVNDVLLTAMAGALRRYMEQRGQMADGLTIRAFVPVNIRPLEEALQLGNRFGLVVLPLPIGLADPRDRLQALKAAMDEIKSSPEAMVSWAVLAAMGLAPTEVETRGLQFFTAKASAVMSNVPGPRRPIYLGGRRLQSIMAWAPASGEMGLSVTIVSYAGQVWLGVMSDAGLVPDPDHIVAAFEAEFAMLHQAYPAPVASIPT